MARVRILLQRLSHIATFDDARRELTDADILVEDACITEVGQGLRPTAVDEVIDGRGLLALPGLVNAHQHLYQMSMRTLPELERSGFVEFLTALLRVTGERWRAGRFGAKEVYAFSRAALVESVLGGVTTVADQQNIFPGAEPEPYMEAAIRAARDVGVRLHACRGTATLGRRYGGMIDDAMSEEVPDAVRRCRDLIDAYHDPHPQAMVRVALAPAGVSADRLEIFDAFAALAAEVPQVRLHTHLHHGLDTQVAQARYRTSPWQVLRERGFASDRMWAAHVVTGPRAEIPEYAEAGIGVATTPAVDLKLGWGLAPVRDLLDAGVSVGAATSGSMVNDGGNLLGDLRVGALAHRLASPDPQRWLSARELLGMATRGSAACLGRDDLGAIAPGRSADIACWDLRGVDRAGVTDPVAALLFTGLSTIASLVLVNGRVVVRDGRHQLVDEVETAALVREALDLGPL
ncbi:MAG TPA: amidohydrolase family protein [Micromonosporaceae bacterium]|nr:amidohydrolase family protein [Micromonosporaceae bacterium]